MARIAFAQAATQNGSLTMNGLTFDSGALIALERRSHRMRVVLIRAIELAIPITAPAAVIGEWWRGREVASHHVSVLVSDLPGLCREAPGLRRSSTRIMWRKREIRV
jgi:hypothetical protein